MTRTSSEQVRTFISQFLEYLNDFLFSKHDSVMLLHVANIRKCDNFIHILPSVMWLSGQTAITQLQYHLYPKVVHHPESNTYSQKQWPHHHWNNIKLYDTELYSCVIFTKTKQWILNFENKQEENKKEINWEIECLNNFTKLIYILYIILTHCVVKWSFISQKILYKHKNEKCTTKIIWALQSECVVLQRNQDTC